MKKKELSKPNFNMCWDSISIKNKNSSQLFITSIFTKISLKILIKFKDKFSSVKLTKVGKSLGSLKIVFQKQHLHTTLKTRIYQSCILPSFYMVLISRYSEGRYGGVKILETQSVFSKWDLLFWRHIEPVQVHHRGHTLLPNVTYMYI